MVNQTIEPTPPEKLIKRKMPNDGNNVDIIGLEIFNAYVEDLKYDKKYYDNKNECENGEKKLISGDAIN